MLAEAEVAAFFRSDQEVSDQLLETAWNLHHVGTVRPQLAIYEPTRQVQANAVAAHIFDLALQNDDLDPGEQLVLTSVEMMGLEPITPCVQSRRSSKLELHPLMKQYDNHSGLFQPPSYHSHTWACSSVRSVAHL